MKIEFIVNDFVKNKIKDIDIIIEKFNHKDVKDFFLLRDYRTKFSRFKESEFEDIKSIYLFFYFKDEFIGLKGNFSIKENMSYKIEFYPIFKDNFSSSKINNKYLFNVEKKILDKNFEQIQNNIKAYKNVLEEIKKDQRLPPKDSLEWKSFIEPYEYFVELKMILLKKDFDSFGGFNQISQEVIKIDSNSSHYNNFINKENSIIDSYDSNSKSFLFIDYENNKNNFDKDFLNKNKFFYSFSRKKFNKNEKQKAENESRLFNLKFERKKSKLSFFQTNNFIDKENFDLDKIKNSSLSKFDIELEVEDFIASEVDANYETLLLRYDEINRFFNEIKLYINDFKNIDDINNLKKNIKENLNFIKKINEIIENTIKKIKINIDNIDDENLELTNKIIYLIEEHKQKNDFINNLQAFEESLKKLKNKIKIKKEENNEKIDQLKKILEEKLRNHLIKFDKEIEIKEIEIINIKPKIKNVNEKKLNLNNKINDFKRKIKKINKEINKIKNKKEKDILLKEAKKELDYYNNKIKDLEINFKKNNIEFQLLNNKKNILKDEINRLNIEKNNLKRKLKLENNEKINELIEKFKTEIEEYQLSYISNENVFLDAYLIEKENIKKLKENIGNILNLIKNKSLKIISYYYDIKIYFNISKNNKNKNKEFLLEKLSNVYLINTGDFVLVDTIRSIIRRVKWQESENDEILSKIIGKLDFNKFDEEEINEEKIINLSPSYEKLNNSQKKAFKNAISLTDPISIIQGPPGTGKTEVITELIKYYRNKREKVIISSQTNIAIKNVLSKLNSGEKIENSVISIWITSKQTNESYSFQNINDTWHKKIFNNLMSNDDKWKDIKKEIRENNFLKKDSNILVDIKNSSDVMVFGATTTTSKTLSNRFESNYIVDAKVLIIDEVSKSILPEILRYAFDVEKVILVGDYKQLNPIFDMNENDFDRGEIDVDKFKNLRKEIQSGIFYELSRRAKKFNRIETLRTNYRSLPGILDAYNVFYDDEGGLESFRKFEEFKKLYSFSNSKYFTNNKNLYLFYVKGSSEEKRGTSRYNVGEIEKIFDVLDDLVSSLGERAKEKDLAIIFPYSSQISLFTHKVKKNNRIKKYRKSFKTINWDTVDSFQGSEANIVILSTVITKSAESTFLTDFRRVNVALSRAKDMLLIFGNKNILERLEIKGEGIKSDKYFRKIFNKKENKYLEIIEMKVGNK